MKVVKHPFFWIIILLAAGIYWLGFYKQYNEKCIHKDADIVVLLDVKNCRNSMLFYYLSNPSKWRFGSEDSKKGVATLFKSGIKTADYFAFFHIKRQAKTVFYCVAEIANQEDFSKIISTSKSTKISTQNGLITYYSRHLGLFIIRYKDTLLLTNTDQKDQNIALKTAEDLFLHQQYLDFTTIKKTINTQNAITIWLQKNSALQEDAIVNINFDENKMEAHSSLKLAQELLQENTFSVDEKALLSLGFNLKYSQNWKLSKTNTSKINKAIGFDADSILSRKPTKAVLILNEIIEKKDSAISYEYDDDFNQIEKVIVHKTREPSFLFAMQCKDPKEVYTYLKTQKAINKEQVFVNFPLAKTSASIMGDSFVLKANSSNDLNTKKIRKRIAFLHINFNKLHQKEWNILLKRNENFEFLQHFSSLEIDITKEKNLGNLGLNLKANKNLYAVLLDGF